MRSKKDPTASKKDLKRSTGGTAPEKSFQPSADRLQISTDVRAGCNPESCSGDTGGNSGGSSG